MAGWIRQVPGFRSGTWWKQVVAVVGYALIALFIIGGATTANATVLVMGLEALGLVLLVSDGWRIRSRVPVLNSANKVAVTGGWVGVLLVGFIGLAAATPFTPKAPSSEPVVSVVATNTPISTRSPQATQTQEATGAPLPTETSVPPTSTATPPTETPVPTEVPIVGSSTVPQADAGCRSGDPLANVYHPQRLQMINLCMSVTGIVQRVRLEEDGDYHVNVKLDSPYANLINAKNISEEGGSLVVEIVPADEPGCIPGKAPKPHSGTYDYGICTGSNIPAPRVGQHVKVTGPYVLDTGHGWIEIHPVWTISPANGDTPLNPLPPIQSPTPAVPTEAATATTGPQGSTLKILSVTSPVSRGAVATLTAQAPPWEIVSVTVYYKSGPSNATGLSPKAADASGNVSWSWKVASTTTPGSWRIVIQTASQTAEIYFTVQ